MEDYSAKLTAEPFLYNETKTIGRYLLDGENETELKKRNVEENLIKHKKIGSVKRVNSPMFRRLKVMDKDMLEEFVWSDIETSKYILLYAIMKTDKLVRDFVIEVYKDKLYMKKEYILPKYLQSILPKFFLHLINNIYFLCGFYPFF